ncbi:MAG TPA: 50S ribosomal protein L21 [Acidobacteria bacterium]|nr:50S ribosomal protein L21 [Acidobacteriota bacterium]
MSDYAIVQHGGKQYRVAPGDELMVERTEPDLEKGDSFLFERVLFLGSGETARVGTPIVEGALVRAHVVAPVRGDKIIVFKKKRRKGYKKTQGHRQNYYRVHVDAIEA